MLVFCAAFRHLLAFASIESPDALSGAARFDDGGDYPLQVVITASSLVILAKILLHVSIIEQNVREYYIGIQIFSHLKKKRLVILHLRMHAHQHLKHSHSSHQERKQHINRDG